MQRLKRVHLLLVLLTLSFLIPTSIAQQTPISFCGKIRNGTPFFLQNSSVETSLLNRMVLCKSQKLCFRTSLGLFPISFIDYTSKLLTISHTTCSSSLHFISPSLLSTGFPPPPQPNSLILFNCSNQRNHLSRFVGNCTGFHGCKACSQIQKQELEGTSSCLLVEDLGKLEKGFDPKELNCSHYSPAYKNTTVDEDIKGFELGTRISFDIPDHVPNICDECEKPHGNCGVGLKCICHPKECKDKVISIAVTMHSFGNIIFSLLSSIFVIVL